jgi:hypothetical protein
MIDDIIEQVEDGKLRCDLGLASTGKTLLTRMTNNSTLQDIAQRIRQQPEDALECLQRAQALYAIPVDLGYLHPDDVVVAAYLFLIAHIESDAIHQFIQRVAQEHRASFRFTTYVSQYLADRMPDTTMQDGKQERPRESVGV